MKIFRIVAILGLSLACLRPILGSGAERMVSVEGRVVTEDTAVTLDPFSWLEQAESADALAWVASQNDRTVAALSSDRRFGGYYERALEVARSEWRMPAGSVYTGRIINGWVHNFSKSEEHPLGVWRRARLDSYLSTNPDWEILLDIDKLSAVEGRRWEMRLPFVDCLADSSRCLVSFAEGGRLEGDYREFDLATRTFVQSGFKVPEAKSRVLWRDRDSVWIVTNIEERNAARRDGAVATASSPSRALKLWKRGQDLEQAKVVYRGAPEDYGVSISEQTTAEGERIVWMSRTQRQDTRVQSHALLTASGELHPLSLPPRLHGLKLHRDHWLLLLGQEWRDGGRVWPAGSLISLPRAEVMRTAPSVQAVMVPGEREAIYDFVTTRSGVLVVSSQNIKGRLNRFTFEKGAWRGQRVTLPDHGSIRMIMTEPARDMVLATFQSFVQPATMYNVNVSTGAAVAIQSDPAQFDGQRFVTEQLEAVSRDGTRIPYFVVRSRAFAYDGRSPTLLRGYGGFGLPLAPVYLGDIGPLWLERGGTFVVANIRGGGEFGPAWHRAATRANRQRAYDDFIAVAEDLIRRRITSPRHLGMEGMSNGGLLVGVMLLQRPELFHAAIARVPVLDLLRDDLLNGDPSAEYGSLRIPEERKFREQVSPYQNLRRGKDLPVPLLITATDDDNVHPAHARKFAAKMQSLDLPVYFYESREGGHSASITQEQTAKLQALQFVYLARELMD